MYGLTGTTAAVLYSCFLFTTTSSHVVLTSTQEEATEEPLITKDLVDHIHSSQNLWQAHAHDDPEAPFYGWTLSRFKRRVMKPTSATNDNTGPKFPLPIKKIKSDFSKLPKHFDARQKWYDCQTIGIVRDQGDCSSCWSFGSTSAISDRMCIHSKNFSYQNMLSARDVMGCCDYCAEKACEGGYPDDAYHFWMTEGVVTGDNYGSEIGCQPYSIAINLKHGSKKHVVPPSCVRNCTNPNGFAVPYPQDKRKGKEAYRFEPNTTEPAMWDLLHNGPITASFDVYSDFAAYRDGIYVRTSNNQTGGHCVVVMGWGEDNGVKYWLVENSWNRVWGRHGYFKIRRGTNEVNFETQMIAGILTCDWL